MWHWFCSHWLQYKKVAKQHLAVMILYIKKTMARRQPGNYFWIKTKILWSSFWFLTHPWFNEILPNYIFFQSWINNFWKILVNPELWKSNKRSEKIWSHCVSLQQSHSLQIHATWRHLYPGYIKVKLLNMAFAFFEEKHLVQLYNYK